MLTSRRHSIAHRPAGRATRRLDFTDRFVGGERRAKYRGVADNRPRRARCARSPSVRCREDAALATLAANLDADHSQRVHPVDPERCATYGRAVVDALAIAAGLDGTLWYYASTGDIAGTVDEVKRRLNAHASLDDLEKRWHLPTEVGTEIIAAAVAAVDRYLQSASLSAY